MDKYSKYVAVTLLGIYVALFSVLAISPYDRPVWFAENMTIIPIVVFLIILWFRGVRFSSLSYVLMSVLIFMHTIGGHYTFERVPFDAVSQAFGFARNNYDRIGHFAVGFYAFPIMEYLRSRSIVKTKIQAGFFALCIIISVAAVYELFEWWYAVNSDPTAGLAVLGSQGDIWDAQKDMLSDTLGGIFAVLLFFGISNRKSNLIQAA